AFKGTTYGVKDTSTGSEQQLAPPLTVTLLGYAQTYTIPNVALTPNVQNIIVVTAADPSFIAETYPMLVTQTAASTQGQPLTVPEVSEVKTRQHGRGYWIRGTSPPNSVVRLYRSSKDGDRHWERDVNTVYTEGANRFRVFAPIRPRILNRFFLTAVVGGVES